MALTQCPECQQPLSTEADACPHCGAPGPRAAAKRETRTFGRRMLALVLVLVVGGCVALFVSSLPPDAPKTTTYQTPARFRLVVEQESLGYGYLKLVGTVENIGESGASNPRLKLRVTRDETLLAEDSTWPAGTALKTMVPGDKAAFEFITRVPGGESSRGMSYELSVEKFAYEVKYSK